MRILSFPHHATEPTAPLERRVLGTVFEEPYTDEFGRAIFTAVTENGMRLDSRSAAPSERERVIASLHEALAESRRHRRYFLQPL